MRNGQNKRMRGRNRNHKSHHSSGGGGGGGGHHHNPLTRVYELNGPEVKIRGTAHHVAEKYLQLARDAQASGDPVTAENHFQHAEHYFRLIAAAQEQFRQQNPYYQAPPAPGEQRDEAVRRRRAMTAASRRKASRCRASRRRASRISAASRTSTIRRTSATSSRPIRRASSRSLTAASSRINYQGRPQHQPQQNQPYSQPPQPYQPQPAQPAAGRRAMSSGCRPSSPARSRSRRRSKRPAPERLRQHRTARRPLPAAPPAAPSRHRRPAAGPAERAAGFPRRRRSRRPGNS